MTDRTNPHRRTVLKTLGASVIGATTLAGTAGAGDTGDNRRQDSFAWANDTLYEMLESEPQAVQDLEPGAIDGEGSHESHRPIWIVGSMDDYSKADEVPGTDHSPHPNPGELRIDHVVPIGGGGEFTAQWHVTLVVRKGETVEYFQLLQAIADAETKQELKAAFADLLSFLNHLPHGDGKGNILTSAATIRAAVDRGDREVIPMYTPTGEPSVFTCPVRPHQH